MQALSEENRLHLTNAAKLHIQDSMKQRGSGVGLRLGVRSSGCSGFAYLMEYADTYDKTLDYTFNYDHFLLVIDQKSLPYLNGMELDYVQEGLNEGFVFNNPNIDATCGCGESFTVK